MPDIIAVLDVRMLFPHQFGDAFVPVCYQNIHLKAFAFNKLERTLETFGLTPGTVWNFRALIKSKSNKSEYNK